MNTFGTLLAGVLFLMVLHAAYIHLIRPVVVFRLRRRLIALRDDLRVRALLGKIPKDDRGFSVLDLRLKRLCESDLDVSVSMILLAMKSGNVMSEVQAKKDQEILESSDIEVRKIWKDACLILGATLVANSPMWWAAIPIILVCAALSSKVKSISSRVFWNAPDGRGASGLGGACPA